MSKRIEFINKLRDYKTDNQDILNLLIRYVDHDGRYPFLEKYGWIDSCNIKEELEEIAEINKNVEDSDEIMAGLHHALCHLIIQKGNEDDLIHVLTKGQNDVCIGDFGKEYAVCYLGTVRTICTWKKVNDLIDKILPENISFDMLEKYVKMMSKISNQ